MGLLHPLSEKENTTFGVNALQKKKKLKFTSQGVKVTDCCQLLMKSHSNRAEVKSESTFSPSEVKFKFFFFMSVDLHSFTPKRRFFSKFHSFSSHWGTYPATVIEAFSKSVSRNEPAHAMQMWSIFVKKPSRASTQPNVSATVAPENCFTEF